MAKRTASQVAKSNVSTSKAHERRVRDLLNTWCGEEIFRRRRVTGTDADTIVLESTGDVIAVGRKPRFNIEAKKGKGFSMTAMLTNPATNLFTRWYFQSTWDSKAATEHFKFQLYPLVFLKPHVNEDWIAISTYGFDTLSPKVAGDSLYDLPHLLFDHYGVMGKVEGDVSHTKKPKIERIELDPCLLCRWKDFADHINPDSFFQCAAVDQTQSPEPSGNQPR